MIDHSDALTDRKIKTLLDKIAAILLDKSYEDLPGLFFGNSGIILFLCYYYKHIKEDEKIYERIEQLIYKVFEQCSAYAIPAFFGTGLSGIGWNLHQLIKTGLLDNTQQHIIDEIAANVEFEITECWEAHNLDHLYGFAGYYIFLSECSQVSDTIRSGIHKFFSADTCFDSIRKILADNSGDGTVNAGLAHGLAGVGLFLVNNSELPDLALADIVKQYYDIAVSWRQKAGSQQYPSVFPNSIGLAGPADVAYTGSRYAWCYGDLGILYFFAKFKSRYASPEADAVFDIVVAACNRRNIDNAAVAFIEKNGCYDIGFCHGLAGIFYLQYKINRLLPGLAPMATNAYWLDLLLTHLTTFLEKEQFDVSEEQEEKRYDPLGLLEGLPGAGLVLISYLTGDTGWDHCFMLNH